MSGLSVVFIQEVKDILNNDNFLVEDFDIRNIELEDYIKLTINYIYIPNYRFDGYIYRNTEMFSCDFSPGIVFSTDSKNDLQKYNFFNAIREWRSNMYNEMKKVPLAREMQRQEEILKKFQENINNIDNLTEEFFTKEEGKELANKLDKLEEMLVNNVDSEEEIEKMHTEIDLLKKQVEVLNKKNWFLSLSTRMFNWHKRNPTIARQVAGFTRELLPEEAKEIVSEEALDQLLLPHNNIEK